MKPPSRVYKGRHYALVAKKCKSLDKDALEIRRYITLSSWWMMRKRTLLLKMNTNRRSLKTLI